jgi:hypothetical protein
VATKYSLEWWNAQRPEIVGRETEKLVEDQLRELNKKLTFAWHRLPDAKSSRGMVAAQPADYLYFAKGVGGGFIEVKALKHETRLPRARVTQLATLNKFGHAGAASFVLIHHYTIGVWRVVEVCDLEPQVASWCVSGEKSFNSAAEALQYLFGGME